MSNKLQELTDKIYQEGVAKGNEEAEKLISSAKSEAEDIVKNAKKEAEKIIADAEKKANEKLTTTDSEIKLSAKQALNSLKQDIINMINGQIVDDSVKASLGDASFVNKIIETTVSNWSQNQEGNIDLSVLISENQEKEVSAYFSSKAKDLLTKGLEIKSAKSVKSGFQVGPKDGSFKISFTDDDFANFFKEYLRPKLVELLFEGK